MEQGLCLSLASHLMPHREPSELQGMGALEATSWALRVAEHELGVTPVLSAQAVVSGSDPLGLIAYLSHFHSAFKSVSQRSGELEGRWAGEGAEGQEVPPEGGGRLYKGYSADSWTLPAGPVSQTSGTPSAILFLGKLQRSLQRTRAKVRSLGRAEAGKGYPVFQGW